MDFMDEVSDALRSDPPAAAGTGGAAPHYRVGEVAYAAGFASVSHFTKCFCGAYRVTPAAYRDQNASVSHR